MLNILFEDNLKKFPYPVITSLYSIEINHGCSGNGEVLKTLENVLGDNTIVYFDVTPDNPEAIYLYNLCVDKIHNKYTNVYLIPIPCIEYYFIRGIISYANEFSVCALTFDNYKKLAKDKKIARKHYKTFEKFCKYVPEVTKECYANDVFISGDCRCDKTTNCEVLSADSKGYRIIYSLPLFVLPSRLVFPSVQRLQSAIEEAEKLYYTIGDHFIHHGIIPIVQSLRKQF